jgi:serine/threonine-protein kinase RsbW
MMAVSAPRPLRAPTLAEEGEPEYVPTAPPSFGLPRTLVLPADPAELPTARLFFASAAAEFLFDETARYQITTATNEAVSNAIRHGAPFEGGVIYLRAATEGGKLVCTVQDAGRLVPSDAPTADAAAEHGRGLSLMRLLMDEVALEVNADGTVVRLSKRGAAAGVSAERRPARRAPAPRRSSRPASCAERSGATADAWPSSPQRSGRSSASAAST